MSSTHVVNIDAVSREFGSNARDPCSGPALIGHSFAIGHLSLRLNCAFVAVFCTPPARAGAGGMVMAANAVADVHSGNGMDHAHVRRA